MPQFTKYALENSLKKLLLQKPLNKITINDITEDCGINRMTFYYHFRDIYDLVEWVCMEDAKKALADNKTYETWQQGFVRIFDAVRDELLHTVACKAAIKANHRLGTVEMYELVRRVFALENINTCPHGRPIIIKMTKKEIEKEFGRTL